MADLKIEIGDDLKASLNKLCDYVEATTGKAPDSAELSKALSRYFILVEIGNQIKWERDNPEF